MNNTISINACQEKTLYKTNKSNNEVLFVNRVPGYIKRMNEIYLSRTLIAPLRGLTLESFLSYYGREDKRLARLVIDQIITWHLKTGRGYRNPVVRFKEGITFFQEVLASRFGVSREWINKLLARMERIGLISTYRTWRRAKRYRISFWFFLIENIKHLVKLFPSLYKVLNLGYQQRSFTLMYLLIFYIYKNILKYIHIVSKYGEAFFKKKKACKKKKERKSMKSSRKNPATSLSVDKHRSHMRRLYEKWNNRLEKKSFKHEPGINYRPCKIITRSDGTKELVYLEGYTKPKSKNKPKIPRGAGNNHRRYKIEMVGSKKRIVYDD